MKQQNQHIQPTSPQLVSVENVALVRGNRLLFKDVNFSLQSGQVIHLQGCNGSGKTSLFKLLTGALAVTTGQIHIFGTLIRDFETSDYHNIMYIGHQNHIKPTLTVEENIVFNSQLFDCVQADDEHIKQALQAVGLWDYRSQLAGALSAGQKRRITLARLWLVVGNAVTHKKLWLLDEPLTALDSDFVTILQEQIDKHVCLGGGVIFTSHQSLQLSCDVQSVRLEGEGV